jgi:hypothetical protein
MKKMTVLIFFLGFSLLYQSLNAQTWTASKRLSWTPAQSWHPAVTTDSDDNIHIVWSEDGNIQYKKSTDGGTTWTTKRLTWTLICSNPSIATDSDNSIHIVYRGSTGGHWEIYYKNSTDGGTTWNTKRLSWILLGSYDPKIAISSSNDVYVVWEGWSLTTREVHYRNSTDQGITWNPTKKLTGTAGYSLSPDIMLDSIDNIHVVWRDETPGNAEIYHMRSTDGGMSWTAKRLTWNSTPSYHPSVATSSSDHVHVVWYDDIISEIYYKKSTDGGVTWASSKRLTWNSGLSLEPCITTDSNSYIHITWYDDSPGWPNHEIYYKRSTNGGTTWTTKRLTWNLGFSSRPSIATDSNNNIHVVWYDDSFDHWGDNLEILYKKGIQ